MGIAFAPARELPASAEESSVVHLVEDSNRFDDPRMAANRHFCGGNLRFNCAFLLLVAVFRKLVVA